MTAMEPEYASLAATPLPELLAALDKIPKRRSSIFTNWAATYRSQTQAIFQPETIDQVRIILELAKRQAKQVRGVGSGHSPSDLVCTNGWGINLDKMQKVINVSSLAPTRSVAVLYRPATSPLPPRQVPTLYDLWNTQPTLRFQSGNLSCKIECSYGVSDGTASQSELPRVNMD